MNILDLLGDSVVLFGSWLPLSHQIVDELQPFHQMIELDQDTNILLRLVIHDIDIYLRALVPFLLLLPLLAMSVSKFLDHPAELHHVDRSASDLCADHIFLVTISDEVLLDYSQEL